eukprot:CAMPEP_0119030804 /NCGR_PEP_ID=MMETSP1176-20130426/41216_1 /TAXON_ID=265551 /ORGANISM="Synedropsis recta cf, Strain CCMP1620" /LENGTH=617 /DNA_ID=CAMNT_0006987181 /DNA_START=62 /DNA_END=1915 /DNA_ORIENTATION=+
MNYTVQATPSSSLVTPVTSSTSSIAENGVVHSQQASAPPSLPPNAGQQELPSLPGSSSTPHHPIAEFLYQLTKMLTENNNEVVEWIGGKIKVHFPQRLEAEVLHKYFRHSKFASFQRQLNYFGFRKIAGKGKMSPCSYVNDAATSDIRSLLLIKRKTNGSAARKAAMAQRVAAQGTMQGQVGFGTYGAMPMSADFLKQALMANPAAQQSLGVYPGMMSLDAQSLDAQQQAALQRQAIYQQQALQAAAAAQQKAPGGESLFLPSDNANALAALAQGQRKLSVQDLGVLSKQPGVHGSLEHLQQLSAARNSALNFAGFGLTPGTSAASFAAFGFGLGSSASLAPMAAQIAMQPAQAANPGPAPPSAPAATMPATAAMNATAALNAAASNPGNTNMFESNSALTALVSSNSAPPGDAQKALLPGTYPQHSGAPMMYGGAQGPAAQALQQRLSSSNLLRGLPSANTMFPDSLSSVSLSGLLPGIGGMSANRLSSMMSLSSFLSRDPSMADLLPGASNANLAGLAGAPLGNTTLLPLTGQNSIYGASQYGGASAALSSLMSAAGAVGPASAAFASFAAAQAPAPGGPPVPAAPVSATAPAPTAAAPVFEPTPMLDSRQKFAA